jgi:hypothetical protein
MPAYGYRSLVEWEVKVWRVGKWKQMESGQVGIIGSLVRWETEVQSGAKLNNSCREKLK